MSLHWKIKHFSELTTEELYEILRLRIEVFVVEQNCPYQDADGKDLNSFHVMGSVETNQLLACARILPPGLSYMETSIGRVCTSPSVRKTGAGMELMIKSKRFIHDSYGSVNIRIGAQSYLQKFYSKLGFETVSEEYQEDNIPHVEMLFRPPKASEGLA